MLLDVARRDKRLNVVRWPNKPMVPTAPTSPIVNPLDPLRRHIGQPLGSVVAILLVQRISDTSGRLDCELICEAHTFS